MAKKTQEMRQIKTTMLPPQLVPAKTEVLTYAGERYGEPVFGTIEARYLEEGDRVVVINQYIDATLNQADEVLMRQPRYEYGKRCFHTQNREGEWITNLRLLLMEGLDVERCEALMDEGEMPEDEYTKLAREAHQIVPEIPEGRFRNWLKGNVIAPEDKDAYSLLTRINPEFESYHRAFAHDGVAYDYYTMYVTARQGVMRHLAHIRGNGGQERRETERKPDYERISLAPEISAVVDEFGGDIDEEHSFAVVEEVEDVNVERKGKKRDRADPRLSSGICTAKKYVGREGKIKGKVATRLEDYPKSAICTHEFLVKSIRDGRNPHHTIGEKCARFCVRTGRRFPVLDIVNYFFGEIDALSEDDVLYFKDKLFTVFEPLDRCDIKFDLQYIDNPDTTGPKGINIDPLIPQNHPKYIEMCEKIDEFMTARSSVDNELFDTFGEGAIDRFYSYHHPLDELIEQHNARIDTQEQSTE